MDGVSTRVSRVPTATGQQQNEQKVAWKFHALASRFLEEWLPDEILAPDRSDEPAADVKNPDACRPRTDSANDSCRGPTGLGGIIAAITERRKSKIRTVKGQMQKEYLVKCAGSESQHWIPAELLTPEEIEKYDGTSEKKIEKDVSVDRSLGNEREVRVARTSTISPMEDRKALPVAKGDFELDLDYSSGPRLPADDALDETGSAAETTASVSASRKRRRYKPAPNIFSRRKKRPVATVDSLRRARSTFSLALDRSPSLTRSVRSSRTAVSDNIAVLDRKRASASERSIRTRASTREGTVLPDGVFEPLLRARRERKEKAAESRTGGSTKSNQEPSRSRSPSPLVGPVDVKERAKADSFGDDFIIDEEAQAEILPEKPFVNSTNGDTDAHVDDEPLVVRVPSPIAKKNSDFEKELLPSSAAVVENESSASSDTKDVPEHALVVGDLASEFDINVKTETDDIHFSVADRGSQLDVPVPYVTALENGRKPHEIIAGISHALEGGAEEIFLLVTYADHKEPLREAVPLETCEKLCPDLLLKYFTSLGLGVDLTGVFST